MDTFAPQLPSRKRAAIRKLGMGTGTLTKVWLRFDRRFWDDVDWIEFVAEPSQRGRFHQWFGAHRQLGEPVLLGFLGGNYAVVAEKLSDEVIVDQAMGVLRTIYGANTPDPVAALIPRWSVDEFALGSYSFHPVGSKPFMRQTLAAPVDDRVFFAGEATDKTRFATVHGGLLSGRRAAQEVMASLG